jgi:hypothetical protein
MKFILFVEGETEQKVLPAFFKRCLDPKFSKSVGMQPVLFFGWSDLVKSFARRAHAYLNGPGREDIIAVVSLLDLYGPDFYPENKTTADQRFAWAKAELEGKVGHPKFRQYFAVHECEAWLLSQPEGLPDDVKKGLPGRHAHPETVDFNEPPKKLLKRLYREKLRDTYKEVTHGSELFAALDPETAQRKCPRLRAMLEDMTALAEQAGFERVGTV